MSVKKILKRIKEGFIIGMKKIPTRIYILALLSIIAITVQVMLYKPFTEMADSSLKYYSEYERHRSHKSNDEELLNQLMQQDQAIRDKYLIVDLEANTNLVKKAETSLVSSFATVDSLVAQGLIFVALAIPYLLLIKYGFIKPVANHFSQDEREKRKALKAGKKVKLLEEKNSSKKVNKENASTKNTSKKKAARHA